MTPQPPAPSEPSCPVCDMLYSTDGGGICTECATGEIGHSYVSSNVTFKGGTEPADSCMYEYRYPKTIRVCSRTIKEHLS